MSIQINPSLPVRVFFALLNSFACVVLLIIRIYHQKKQKREVLKLSVASFSCIFVALVCCLGVANTTSDWIFGDFRWCGLSLRFSLAAYTLHRVLLYMFIILRLEVINKSKLMDPRLIKAAKIVIGIIGISMVVVTTLSIHGTTHSNNICTLIMRNDILITFFAFDALICCGGTWMFMRPLRKTLRQIERGSVRYILEKTRTWSLVSLVATIITLLTIVVTDGAGGVITFDCSITSFSLVMMMAPLRRKLFSKNDLSLSKKSSGKVEVIRRDVQKKPSGLEPSIQTLDKEFEEVLKKRDLVLVH